VFLLVCRPSCIMSAVERVEYMDNARSATLTESITKERKYVQWEVTGKPIATSKRNAHFGCASALRLEVLRVADN
jgi:hypothetical protein